MLISTNDPRLHASLTQAMGSMDANRPVEALELLLDIPPSHLTTRNDFLAWAVVAEYVYIRNGRYVTHAMCFSSWKSFQQPHLLSETAQFKASSRLGVSMLHKPVIYFMHCMHFSSEQASAYIADSHPDGWTMQAVFDWTAGVTD